MPGPFSEERGRGVKVPQPIPPSPEVVRVAGVRQRNKPLDSYLSTPFFLSFFFHLRQSKVSERWRGGRRRRAHDPENLLKTKHASRCLFQACRVSQDGLRMSALSLLSPPRPARGPGTKPSSWRSMRRGERGGGQNWFLRLCSHPIVLGFRLLPPPGRRRAQFTSAFRSR